MATHAPSNPAGIYPVKLTLRLLKPLLMAVVFTASCAYYNTFYNARDWYQQGVKSLEAAGLQSGDDPLPSNVRGHFQKAIEKSQKVLDEYSDSKYVEESLYIMGRSSFYLGELGLAERYLQMVLDENPEPARAAQVRLFMAKTHHAMGRLADVREDLAPLLESGAVSKNILSEIYILQGDIALASGQMQEAIRRFQFAAEFAPRDAARAQIYYRLFSLLQAEGQPRAALDFHDQYRRFTPNLKERQQAVITRVQLLQELGDLDAVYAEIQSMLNLSEFVEVAPALQLELAKVEYARGNASDYVEALESIRAKFSRLVVASDAAYLLGEYSLINERDIEAARAHFAKVKPAARHHAKAKMRLAQLDRLAALETQMETLTIRAQADSAETDTGAVPAQNLEGMTPQNSGDGNAIASLLYRLGEIAFIDLADTARALEYMAQIYHQYDNAVVAPRAVYVLYLLSARESESQRFWENILMESYGQSQFAGIIDGRSGDISISGIDSLATLADAALQKNPAEALRIFEQIRDRYQTAQSTFAIAYIYDIYLSRLDLAISGYEEHLEKHAEGPYSETARDRLNLLLQVKASAAQSEDQTGNPR